ncbi:MAG: class I SAM-dependent methyltransferase, partial [Oscillospiraceae bacterium]|nr:class I SAM-dependent methyltransferase [Oscillospiraceae bacterium]
SEGLILKYNPAWTGGGMRRCELREPDWSGDLFVCLSLTGFTVSLPFTPESWHGRMLACRGIGASSLPKGRIAEWSDEHRAYMGTLPDVFHIPHWVTVMAFRLNRY